MRYIAPAAIATGLFLTSGCETLGLGGGPSADELRLTAEDMRTEARALADAGLADAASAMGSAATVADAAADASEGDISGVINTVVAFIPPPYNTIAASLAAIGLGVYGRRRSKALKQVVTGIQAGGGPTDSQSDALETSTSTRTKAAIDAIVGNIGNA